MSAFDVRGQWRQWTTYLDRRVDLEGQGIAVPDRLPEPAVRGSPGGSRSRPERTYIGSYCGGVAPASRLGEDHRSRNSVSAQWWKASISDDSVDGVSAGDARQIQLVGHSRDICGDAVERGPAGLDVQVIDRILQVFEWPRLQRRPPDTSRSTLPRNAPVAIHRGPSSLIGHTHVHPPPRLHPSPSVQRVWCSIKDRQSIG
ncbi:hypothetical protein [Micromonospora yangpuensis]|uniref:hypothetical protein n=1 Tax=Micromonospora yangpuensis TaxID=683228 RepID=UPI001586B14C|nr:hypothetical protein [Micromonospora yangpuensis]